MQDRERRRNINFYIRQVMTIEKQRKREREKLRAIQQERSPQPPGPYWSVYLGLKTYEHILWHGGMLPGFRGPETLRKKLIEDGFTDFEPRHFEGIYALLEREPFWKLVIQSCGVGQQSHPVGLLMGHIMGYRHKNEDGEITAEGIACFDKFSQLCKAMALAVEEDGTAQHPQTGQKHRGNYHMKSIIIHVIANTQLIKKTSPYRTLYVHARSKYDAKARNGDKGPSNCWIHERPHKVKKGKKMVVVPCIESGHPHRCAVRIVAKEWLKHFWQRWREVEGLPVPLPYDLDHYTDPSEYGWPKA